jgi:hypothetical protein
VVYDINDTAARWASDAFDVVVDHGYSGSKDDYHDALSQVGNMSAILDAILEGGA